MINKDSDLQQLQSDYDLTVTGHEIWITDFIVSVETSILQAGLGLASVCSPHHQTWQSWCWLSLLYANLVPPSV